MEPVEAEGDSVEAAVATALGRLGVARDAVEVEVLEEGARGFLGIGARPARVRVRRTDRAPASEPRVARDPTEFAQLADPADLEELAGAARQALLAILQHMEVAAEVAVDTDAETLRLDIEPPSGAALDGWLIGRRGQTLDALEYLVARIVARDRQAPVRVVVDAEGYRARREAALAEMAHRAAHQAKRSGRPVPMAPMTARERRVVHLALQDDPGVRTHSTGEGAQRRLVIAPSDARGRPGTSRPHPRGRRDDPRA